MKERHKAVLLGLLLCIFASFDADAAGSSDLYCGFRVAGFYPDYYADEFPISSISFGKLTDIIYFSVYPNPNGFLDLSSINQKDPNTMADVVQAAKDHNVKVWISVGGAGRSQNFESVVSDPVKRTTLVNQLVTFAVANDFDGIDLDWEPITDSVNYGAFILELKAAMRPHSLLLSVDVYALGEGIGSEIFDVIDWLHVMAYDMFHHTKPHSLYEDALAGLVHWEEAGFPRPKMILGLPFFGRQIVPEGQTSDYYAYKDIVTDHWFSAVDPNADEIDGIYYNGINTIKAKTQYVVENGYGGIMFWELTNDTLDETSLLTAAVQEVHMKRPPDFNCDNVISIQDLSYLVSEWLMTECDVDNFWCQRRDLDVSSTVDLPDYARLALHWKQVLRGDINNDTYVNMEDIALLIDQWLWEGAYGGIPEDVYIDGRVNVNDFAIIAQYWLMH